jgi:hypothetical protein
MADESLEIVIRSKGGEQVVAQFKAVSTGAQQMGVTTEAAAKKASTSLQGMGKDSDDLNRRMAAMGAAITTGAAILGQWSRSAQDAAAIQRQLEASIAATGESFETYSAQIEEVGARAVQLGQDDEAASQAISALTQITGSASVAIEQMGLVFDLAAAKGMSLESAAELVGKVHEGNTSILQRYGIVVREGATAEEALAAIQQQVAGQAEAHATTYARLREELSNVTDAIGGAVGGFAPMLALLPGVSSGFTLAGSAIGAIAPNLTKATAATTALNLALGPVGLVLAAGAAAGALVYLATQLNDVQKLEEASASASTAFANELATLGATGSAAAKDFEAVSEAFGQILLDQAALAAAIEGQGGGTAGIMDALDSGQINDIRDAILALFNNPFIDSSKVEAELTRLFAAFQSGEIDSGELTKSIEHMNSAWSQYAKEADKAAAATANFSEVFGRLVSVGEDWENLEVMTLLQWAKNSDTAADSLGNLAKRASEGADAIEDTVAAKYEDIYATQILTAANDDNAGSLNNLFRASVENGKAMTEHAEAAKESADASMRWRVEATEGASTLGTLAAQASAGAGAMGGLTGTLNEATTAMQRMAIGQGTANDALAAFKGIQDGIISQQDVFNSQFSEYGSQISDIERAQDILNQRREDGQKLQDDELSFLDEAPGALDRLNAGQEDAAISAGKLAAQYGENMSQGDRLNQSLSGVSDSVSGLTGVISALTLALIELDSTDANAHVSVGLSGLSESDIDGIGAALRALDGTTATTTIVNQHVGVGPDAGIALHGGVMGYANGGITRIVAGEAGYELMRFANGGSAIAATYGTYSVPVGTMVTPHPESAQQMRGGGLSVVINMNGDVHGVDGVEEVVTTLDRALRARWAALGMN